MIPDGQNNEVVLVSGAEWQAAGLEDSILQHILVKRLIAKFTIGSIPPPTVPLNIGIAIYWAIYKLDADEPPPVSIRAPAFLSQERVLQLGAFSFVPQIGVAQQVDIIQAPIDVDTTVRVKCRQDEFVILGMESEISIVGIYPTLAMAGYSAALVLVP